MAVLSLVKKNNRDTVDALRYLLDEAQKGDLDACNVTFKRPGGDEESLCTGVYKARPEVALMAIMRFSMILMNGSGELDHLE